MDESSCHPRRYHRSRALNHSKKKTFKKPHFLLPPRTCTFLRHPIQEIGCAVKTVEGCVKICAGCTSYQQFRVRWSKSSATLPPPLLAVSFWHGGLLVCLLRWCWWRTVETHVVECRRDLMRCVRWWAYAVSVSVQQPARPSKQRHWVRFMTAVESIQILECLQAAIQPTRDHCCVLAPPLMWC